MNVTLDQISSQCFARTNKVLLSTPLERIHTSTQLPDLNGANFFENAVMRLCLHRARAEAHKEQVKDVLVSNVRQQKEGEGEERTRATTQKAGVRSG